MRQQSNAKGFFESKDIIDMKNPNCIDCDECCSILAPLSEDELDVIKKFLATKKGKEIYEKAKKNRTIPAVLADQSTVNLICPFVDENKKCMIYDIRPEVCRLFHCDKEKNKELEIKNFEYPFKICFIYDLFER
jgi:Fe-S-cluster containining protein